MTTTSDHPLERFLPLLASGDSAASEADLAAEALILDPQAGTIPPPVLPFFLPARYMWLSARQARVETVRTIRSAARVVVEQVLHLVIDGSQAVVLPVALAGETDAAGKLVRVRIYHSTRPLTGHRDVRGPLLDADATVSLAEPVSTHVDALARGDLEAVLATFAEDAGVSESAGAGSVHVGAAARRAFYAARLGDAEGGIACEPCTITDDGAACAVEHNVVRWGDRMLPTQAGIAVYQRASPRLLAAVRIYDDAEPPPR